MNEPDGAAAAPAAALPGDTRPAADRTFWIVSLCFFLSGAAGLVYQMVWMRYLATVFGTSELAIVAVLVAYMGGLAVGAWAASKFVNRLRRPVLVYAVLELAIAVSAVAVPLLLNLVDRLYTAILGGQAALPGDGGVAEAIAHLLLSCVVLMVPTACMGATLPILAKGVVHRSEQIGRRVGWLYALNTVGAVAGTVLAAFVLIPALGLWRSSFVGVGLNLLVALLGWSVAKGAVSPDRIGEPEGRSVSRAGAFGYLILAVMLVSGGVAFAYEVLWARLLAHLLGGSMYAFATMLAAFLSGIAVGGLVGAKLAREGRRSAYWLAGVEIATGLLTASIFAAVSSEDFGGGGGGDPSLAGQALLCVLILLPATLCLGATFPLAVRCLAKDPGDAGRCAGQVYSWNTVGAIVGAVGAGYFLIPALGFALTFKWAITLNLLLGALLLLALRPAVPRPVAAAAAALVLASSVLYQPKPPLALLTMSPYARQGAPAAAERHKLVYSAVGRSATVAVIERQGSYLLRTNGLPEAEIFPKGAASLSYTHIRWLPALPKVLRPETDSLLVVGFGGGALLEDLPPGYAAVDVVEIEEEVIAANRAIADKRAIDPLQDARIHIAINDARGALKLTRTSYGAIVSQPSHPWTAGASHLYTREFLELAGQHLDPGGIFVQWLGSQFVDEQMLRAFCATMLAVFPHVQLYLIGDNFLFVGSAAPLDTRMAAGEDADGGLFHLSGYPKLSYVEDLLAVLQLDEAGCRQLGEGHRPITDDRNLMATGHLPGTKLDGAMNEPGALRGVLGPLHFLNRDATEVRERLKGLGTDVRYLTQLLKSGSPTLDRIRFSTETLTGDERLLIEAASALDSQPDKALSLLRTVELSGAANAEIHSLKARAQFSFDMGNWASLSSVAAPVEFAEFLSSHQTLADAVERLTESQRTVLEAVYWMATNQLERARGVEGRLATFNDHRSVWFEPANQVRLRYLIDTAGKSPQQQEADARAAVALLDRLLALPLERNLPLVSARIALAQRFGDVDFLTSAGWIIARKLRQLPANAPQQSRAVFGNVLGSLFAPYAPRAADGSVQIGDADMADFYLELSEWLGEDAILLPRGKD